MLFTFLRCAAQSLPGLAVFYVYFKVITYPNPPGYKYPNEYKPYGAAQDRNALFKSSTPKVENDEPPSSPKNQG